MLARVTANDSIIQPTVMLTNVSAIDQDDMCVFPGNKESSGPLVFVSDKKADAIFAYTFDGDLVDTTVVSTPGNIDLRSNVRVGDRLETVVVVNLRNVNLLAVFVIDRSNHRLKRLDSGEIKTIENYGGTLYHDKQTGTLHFITTSKEFGAAQYCIINSNGDIDGSLIRRFEVGMCEGAVSDDNAGIVYISDERKGVWRFDLSSNQKPAGTLVVRVGEHGLIGDLEGLALVTIDNKKCLIVSDQGSSRFRAYAVEQRFEPCGVFAIDGAKSTDGIEITLQVAHPFRETISKRCIPLPHRYR